MQISEFAALLAGGYWTQIRGFSNYLVSIDGDVFSFVSGRVLRPIRVGEYFGLQIKSDSGSRKNCYLHRLVLQSWGDTPQGLIECRHLDGDRANNRLANLSWGTPSENAADKLLHGTAPIGEKNGGAVLTDSKVIAMRTIRRSSGLSYAEIASKFNISTMTAYRAIVGQSWRHVNEAQ